MTPDDFRAVRNSLGLTQHELAKALEMGRWGFQTVGKWERGEQPVPGPVRVALRCLLEHGELPERYLENL